MDINELKAKLAGLEKNGKAGPRAIWKPTDEHTVRLLQFPGDASLGDEVRYHFNIGGHWRVYCPQNVGDDCDICEADAQLRAWKDEKGRDKPEALRKQQFAVARQIEAGPKHFIPIIVRGKGADEFEGPFWWEVSKATNTRLLNICANDDWNTNHPDGGVLKILTSYTHGLDVRVSYKKVGEKGNTKTMPITDVEERKVFTPIFPGKGGPERGAELFAQLPKLNDVIKVQSASEVSKIYQAWVADGGAEAPQGDGGIERSSNNAEIAGTKGASVEDSIAKLQGLMAKRKSEGDATKA